MNITNKAIHSNSQVIALLGPTNTGKTYEAIEQMCSHNSGVMGFPLRLLARENYERMVKIKGRHAVALVTGEEKIIPRHARYFLCTVEAMPIEQDFEFLGVDEIQLAADPDRGHVFTDRLLRARGTRITVFLGAETMRPVLSGIIPGIEFQSKQRFSALSYSGYKKLLRLPKRTAVVAFSMDDVYDIAEQMRRQRGGTAVVLGALSPRTRNAQVEMYQSGEVDFMVATDAIGMGLNMDIHHVALAATRKFDGRKARYLRKDEMAQIAGRAGRYRRDGTFGVTGRVQELDADDVDAIENHKFEAVREICWRNAALDFSTPIALMKSLEYPSGHSMLARGRNSDDYSTLTALMKREEIMRQANNSEMVRLLWDVCQIPDFRKTMADTHENLIADIFQRLSYARLDEDWVAKQIKRLDNMNGDVDMLMTRIAHIRTWTYISYKHEWLQRHEYWQGQARDIEDRLSDALHQALLHRFVDQRASVLIRSMEEKGNNLLVGVRANGEVVVEGHLIGHLHAFRFIPDETHAKLEHKAVMSAAKRALKDEIKRRLTMILKAQPDQFQLSPEGHILWQEKQGNPLPGQPIASVSKGDNILRPVVELVESELLADQDSKAIQEHLQRWLNTHITAILEPLIKLADSEEIHPSARGIAFQVFEAMGIVPREKVQDLINDIDAEGRAALRARKVRLGPILVFVPALNKPAAVKLRALLWSLWNDKSLPVSCPPDGMVSQKLDKDEKDIDKAFYQSIGYPVYGDRAIRIDMLDRVISAVYDGADQGKFHAQHEMAEWLGCSIDDLYDVLTAMGHKKIDSKPSSVADESNQSPEPEAKAEAEPKVESGEAEPEKSDDTPEGDKVAEGEGASDDNSEAGEQKKAPEKPVLAQFWLKKGKAFEKGSKGKKPFHKGKGKGDEKGDKKKPHRGKGKNRGPKQPKIMSVGPEKKLEDSPFAILEQLKKGNDS